MGQVVTAVVGSKLGWRGLAVLVLAALPGCWLQADGGADNARFNGVENVLTPATVTSLEPKWSVGLAGGTASEPIVSGNRVYTTRTKAAPGDVVTELAVEARDTATGGLVWQRSLIPPVSSGYLSATPVVLIDGALWVSYSDAESPLCTSTLVRLDPATGAVLSTEDTESISSSLVGDGTIVASTGRVDCSVPASTLVVRDQSTRSVLWSYTFPPVQFARAPVIAGGKIYVVAGAQLYAFSAGGCGAATCPPLWQQNGVADTARPVAGPDGQVFVVHVEPGAGAEVFLASIQAYSGTTGDLLWQTALGDPSEATAVEGIAVGGNHVYVPVIHDPNGQPTTELAVYPTAGCSAATCEPSWVTPMGPGATFRPTVGGGVVYVTLHINFGLQSALVAAPANGCGTPVCAELHRLTRSGWSTPPSLSGGRLFAVAEHDLVAYGLP